MDNIVELAQVFGVSVDELLNLTVREKEAELTAQGVGRLLDEQAARQEQRMRRLTRLLIAVAAVLLTGVALSAALGILQTRRVQQRMDERIASMNAQLGSRISSIELNVANSVRQAIDDGKTRLSDGGCRGYEYVHDSQSLLMRVFAYPQTLTAQESAEFYAVLEDGTRLSAPAERVSAGFEAEISVPAGKADFLPVSVYVTWQGADGQATEKVFEENIYMTNLRISVMSYFANLHYSPEGDLMVMPAASIDFPYDQPDARPVHVKYEVYMDGELRGGAAQELSVHSDSTYITEMPEEEIRIEGMVPFESLMLRVFVTDARGNVFTDECVPEDFWPEADPNAQGIVQ